MRYRHEMKYVCSEAQMAALQDKIKNIMDIDKHTDESNQYNIRSVYFDDFYNSVYYENENGSDTREKFRIRIYNQQKKRIRLELKKKHRDKTQKLICMLTEAQCKVLLAGQALPYDPENPPILQKLCLFMNTRLMRPKVIVVYDRTPFVYKDGNVRVTFDRNIASSTNTALFFNDQLPVRPLMPTGQHILEVKWDEYLPDFIYSSMQLDNLQRTSFSKYYLSRKLSPGGIWL